MSHQTVTNGQQCIVLRSRTKIEAVLEHTDGNATDQVDGQDQQAGDGVALDEFTGAVHRAVEVCFLGNFRATVLGFFLVDKTGIEIGIDGHLLTRHGIQGETCAYFRHPASTFGDHQEVDDHEDGEDHQANRVVTADKNRAERLDHLTGRITAFMAVEQNNPCGCNVERQPQQCCHQQNSRKGCKLHRPQGVDTHQQDHDRQGNVEGEEHVQHERRHGQNHHAQQPHQHHGNADITPRQGFDIVED